MFIALYNLYQLCWLTNYNLVLGIYIGDFSLFLNILKKYIEKVYSVNKICAIFAPLKNTNNRSNQSKLPIIYYRITHLYSM